MIDYRHISKYEGDLKSSWPSITETWDKRPLGRELDRSLCHRHTTSIIKLLVRSSWLHGHRRQYTGKVKSSLMLSPISMDLWAATKKGFTLVWQ